MISKIWNFFLKILDPHRVYMGQKVYRTKVFWTTVIYSFGSAYIYSIFESFVIIGISLVVAHVLDFIFYLISEKYFNNLNAQQAAMRVREWV